MTATTGSGNTRTATFTPTAAAVQGELIPYVRIKSQSYLTASGLSGLEETLYLDVVAPVAVTYSIPAATYAADSWLPVSVRFSESMDIAPNASIRLLIGGVEKTASFDSYDASTATAIFKYQIETGLSDSNGVDIVSANGVTDAFRNAWTFESLHLNSSAVILA